MPLLQNLAIKYPGLSPEWLKPLYLKVRGWNAGARALPDFVIIGAQKAGSTSLFNYLCQHPQIYGSMPKEIFYFNREFDRGENWYRRHFPKQEFLRRRQAICGEASTMYLYSEQAPQRLAAMLPNIKIIAILREPAARAVSHYNHDVFMGREKRSVDEVFSEETISCWAKKDSLSKRDRAYFERGCYGTQLTRWSAAFPHGQFLVLFSETFFANPQATVDEVSTFLGLDRFPLPSCRVFKAAPAGATKPRAFDSLKESFRVWNRQLEDLSLKSPWGA